MFYLIFIGHIVRNRRFFHISSMPPKTYGSDLHQLKLYIIGKEYGKIQDIGLKARNKALKSSAIKAYHGDIGSWRITSPPVMKSFGTFGTFGAGENKNEKLTEKHSLDKIDFTTDLDKLYFYQEGCNDEDPWILIGKLHKCEKFKNGLYFHFKASCDFTGFDCQGGGIISLESDLQSLIDFVSSDNYDHSNKNSDEEEADP